MIPKELNTILDSLEFENDGLIFISNLDIQIDFIEITLSIRLGTENKKEFWIIKVDNHKDHVIASDVFFDIQILTKHCLLSSYNGYTSEIFVNDRKNTNEDLFSKLYLAHRKHCQDWIPFDRYIPHSFDNLKHFELDYGSFTRGPLELLEVYSDTLKGFYNKVNIVGKYGRKVHIPDIDFETEKSIYKLLILGTSYIIGENFKFEKK